MSSVDIVIKPEKKDLGDNFIVRRTLPDPKKRSVGPFVFWDHMGPAKITPQNGMKVREHPHIGLATITWLFSGEIMHRDSLGNEQKIRPGEVNWMTAGKGITHSERSEPENSGFELEGIQLWLGLPKECEEVDASFYHCKLSDVPLIEKEDIKMRLIAGNAFDKKSPIPVYSDLFYINGEGPTKSKLSFPVKENHELAVYMIKGKIEIEEKSYERFDLVSLKKGEDLNFTILEDAHFMIFGGEVFPEKRHMWWNFVSTSKEKIEEAKKRWQEDKFPKTINEDERIPLPEK